MITLHKKISYNFFFRNFGLGNFQAILGKFRGNSDWDWGRISAPNRVQKKPLCHMACLFKWKFHVYETQVVSSSIIYHGI